MPKSLSAIKLINPYKLIMQAQKRERIGYRKHAFLKWIGPVTSISKFLVLLQPTMDLPPDPMMPPDQPYHHHSSSSSLHSGPPHGAGGGPPQHGDYRQQQPQQQQHSMHSKHWQSYIMSQGFWQKCLKSGNFDRPVHRACPQKQVIRVSFSWSGAIRS